MSTAAAFSLTSLRSDTLQSAPRQLADAHNPVCTLVHSVAPSRHPENDGVKADMRPQATGRTVHGLQGGREQTRASLQRKFKVHFPDTAKNEARRIGVHHETVEIYKQVNVPQAWAQFAEVCKANPAFALDILEDLGIDLDGHRDAYAMFLELERQIRGR